jgi:hypothetical protein
LHERLAAAGDVALGAPASGLFGGPPGWSGEPSPFSAPGVHGVARARRWDAVATAEAPQLRGDHVTFVRLPTDRLLVVDGDERPSALEPLARALADALPSAYRAEAVRRGDTVWAVGARRIDAIEAPELEGETIELTVVGGRRTLVVDGGPSPQPVQALAEAGAARARDFVVRARRLQDALWEVEVSPL